MDLLSFDAEEARAYGLNEAILLNYLRRIRQSGYTLTGGWVIYSMSSFIDDLRCFSAYQIRYALKNLQRLKLIEVDSSGHTNAYRYAGE